MRGKGTLRQSILGEQFLMNYSLKFQASLNDISSNSNDRIKHLIINIQTQFLRLHKFLMNIYQNILPPSLQVMSNGLLQFNAIGSCINPILPYYCQQLQYSPQVSYLLPVFYFITEPSLLYQKPQIEPLVQEMVQIESKEIKTHKKFKYAKKNAESNIVNQVFSFLSSPSKSKAILKKILKDSSKVELFYELVKQIKKKNSKYINRDYLKNLIQLNQNHIVHGILKRIDYKNIISLEELKLSLRILTKFFLKNKCINVLLTSAKLDRSTKKEHLQRRNDVWNYLIHQMSINKEHK